MKDILFELDILFKNTLQKDVEFYLNNKLLKSGKFYLFEHGHFNFVFFIKTKTKDSSLKIPIPFDFCVKDDIIELNYKMEKFTNNQMNLKTLVERLKSKTPSKYYDNVLVIKVLQ